MHIGCSLPILLCTGRLAGWQVKTSIIRYTVHFHGDLGQAIVHKEAQRPQCNIRNGSCCPVRRTPRALIVSLFSLAIKALVVGTVV